MCSKNGVCLCMCRIGEFGDEIEWEKMLALACTALEKVWCYVYFSKSRYIYCGQQFHILFVFSLSTAFLKTGL